MFFVIFFSRLLIKQIREKEREGFGGICLGFLCLDLPRFWVFKIFWGELE